MPPKRKKGSSDDDEPAKPARAAKAKPGATTRGKKGAAVQKADDGGDGNGAKKATKKRAKKKNSDDEDEHVKVKEEKEDTTIPWQNPEHRSMTDQLLTEIEDNDAMRCALGFDPFGAATVRGLKQVDYHRMLAKKVILAHPDFAHWTLERATLAVKNRLDKLKKTFGTYKAQLNDTGEGLPFDEESGKLPDEHPHQNLYEKILSDFPWYYRVRNLLVKSPIYDRSAVANSATPLDFSFMASKGSSPDVPPPASASAATSGAAIPISDSSDSSSSSDDELPTSKATRAPTGSAAAKPSQADAVIRPVGAKKKLTQIETLNMTLERDVKQRQVFLADALKAKQDSSERKAERKQDLQLKMLQMKLDARAKREQEQREHEYRLAQIQLGIPATSTAPHPMSTSAAAFAPIPSVPPMPNLPFPSFDSFSAPMDSSFTLPDSFPSSSVSGSSTPSTSYSSLGDDVPFPSPPPPAH